MKITTFLLFSCAVLSISACQNTTIVNKPITPTVLSSQQFNEILQQHTWTYTPPNSTVPILVNISTQGADIYSGCNQISKQHELNGNLLQSKSIQLQTLMGCGHLQDQENLASKIFSDAHLTILNTENQSKQLKVTLKDSTSYNFQPIPYIADLKNYDAELLKKFTWQHITDDQNQVQKQALLLNFDPDRVRYYSGCNRNYYKYSIENNTIFHLGHYGGTVMMCPINLQEKQFEKLSAKPFHFKFDYSTTFPKLILESKYQPNMIFQAIPRKKALH